MRMRMGARVESAVLLKGFLADVLRSFSYLYRTTATKPRCASNWTKLLRILSGGYLSDRWSGLAERRGTAFELAIRIHTTLRPQ
jgi:hypothetical protein